MKLEVAPGQERVEAAACGCQLSVKQAWKQLWDAWVGTGRRGDHMGTCTPALSVQQSFRPL